MSSNIGPTLLSNPRYNQLILSADLGDILSAPALKALEIRRQDETYGTNLPDWDIRSLREADG